MTTPFELALIVVEGKTDRNFFELVILPRIRRNLRNAPVILHESDLNEAQKKEISFHGNNGVALELLAFRNVGEIARALLESDSESRTLKILLKDNDHRKTLDERKEEIIKKYNQLRPEDIEIAVQEIESWVAAGFGPKSSLAREFIGIDPESIDKEIFHKIVAQLGFDEESCEGQKYITSCFMLEYVTNPGSEYDFKYALSNSKSLKHFYDRFSVNS